MGVCASYLIADGSVVFALFDPGQSERQGLQWHYQRPQCPAMTLSLWLIVVIDPQRSH